MTFSQTLVHEQIREIISLQSNNAQFIAQTALTDEFMSLAMRQ